MMDTLMIFNQQVAQCQDDAYTLAWYLLGDETAADQITQAAVAEAFRCARSRQGRCTVIILRQVLRRCAGSIAANGCLPVLRGVPPAERPVLVLADILGVGYTQCAAILGCSVHDVARRLARARKSALQEANFV